MKCLLSLFCIWRVTTFPLLLREGEFTVTLIHKMEMTGKSGGGSKDSVSLTNELMTKSEREQEYGPKECRRNKYKEPDYFQ